MKMRALHILALGFGLTLGLASCPSSGGGGGGSSMAITSCTLGCATGGTQVSCGVTDVYVNQEIRITFTDPVLISSVNNSTFQVVDISTGKTPPGSFSVDAQNSRILIYRPQLTFDSSGNPIFGLTADATYTFKIPGESLDPTGPYIKNTNGAPNQNRLLCTLVASRGIFDANPGPPSVGVTIEVRDLNDEDGDGDTTDTVVKDAQGAVDAAQETSITMVFDDIMNPGTLANPVTGTSTTVTVRIDPDGDTTDPSDQLELAGAFSISIDQDALITTVIFIPDGGLPSAGENDPKRKVVLSLPEAIKDLGGNSLANAGNWVFTPEVITFVNDPIVEDFENATNEDDSRTGSTWSSGGLLVSGTEGGTPSGILGGGSGQLGDLLVPTGTTVTLKTGGEDFDDIDGNGTDPAVFDLDMVIDSPGAFTVPDGIFEFSTVRVEAGATLMFVGPNPARVYARGEVVVQGLVDVSGTGATGYDEFNVEAPVHDGRANAGGIGGAAGPGGGLGGEGGQRADGSAFTGLDGVDGIPNLPPPALYEDVDGKPGGGVPYPDTLSTVDYVGFGAGGDAWPHDDDLGLFFPADPDDILGMQFERLQSCRNRSAGGAGGGGAFSLDGLDGISNLTGTFGDDPADPPPPGEGGLRGDIFAGLSEDEIMSLDPALGYLRGGAGGGGAGGHLQATSTTGTVLNDCFDDGSGSARLQDYYSYSSAGGGGAGGGLQIQTGRRVVVNGVVDSSGGDGGSNFVTSDDSSRASPGGGGSGGSVLLQSRLIQVQTVPGRIDIGGGSGGTALDNSLGGLGSPGLLRMETFEPIPNFGAEAAKVLPDSAFLFATWGATAADIFTIAPWDPQPLAENALSGAQSCWIHPPGNYFLLDFESDDIGAGTLGWDMNVIIDGFGVQSWRGTNDIYGVSLETQFGNDLGAAPLVVRFQGARVSGTLSNPCNVDLYGVDSAVHSESRTYWFKHPEDLNISGTSDHTVQPNMIRFVVIWDATQLGFDEILGIEDITISALRD